MSSSEGRSKTPKGSVKAARERAQAGIQRPNGPPSSIPISRPIQMPQWPLNSNGNSANISPATLSPPRTPRSRKETPPRSPVTVSPNATTPPRRPERPRDVPSMLDSSKIQHPVPSFQSTVTSDPAETQRNAHHQRQQQPEYLQDASWSQANVLLSPGEPSTPGTGLSGASNSSRPSTQSSFGSIPDFPVPDIPPQAHTQLGLQPGPPRRSLGPPPSSRRGVSSYYSHNSYVAPIPEEHQDGGKTHNSYASSSAVPKSWVDGPPDYYMTAYREEDEEDEDGRDSRESRSTEPDENTGLVRKASLGRHFKPSLTTVRSNSSSSSDQSRENKPPMPAPVAYGTAGAIAAAAGGAIGPIGIAESHDETLPARAYGNSQPNSQRGTPLTSPQAVRSGSTTPKADPRVRQILGGLEKGGAIGDVGELPPSAIRRPPRLDIGAVQETQSRGSMTSLPDLIKRATKLASNLDKGRTASRLGMLDFNSSDPNLLNKLNAHRDEQLRRQRDSTISGILSSFPAPVGTPTQDKDQTWNGGYEQGRELMTPMSPLKPEGSQPRRGRRCCGMPLWVFLVVLVLLLIVIAAAIVLPVALVVLPQNNATSSGPDLSNCAKSNPCGHGGISTVSNNACQCICKGGFTGASCNTANDGACTSANIGTYSGVTIGNSVPRIFTAAAGFQIPLNATAILATFSNSDIACASENALMAFDGQTQKREMEVRNQKAALKRQQAVTSNGVILASPAATSSGSLPTAATVSGTAVATAPAAAPTNAASGTDTDFARVAILYALERSLNLNTALNVQQVLMSKLQNGAFKGAPVNAGSGVVVDFNGMTLTVNGTKA